MRYNTEFMKYMQKIDFTNRHSLACAVKFDDVEELVEFSATLGSDADALLGAGIENELHVTGGKVNKLSALVLQIV